MPGRLLMGVLFYPRGGSAHAARAIVRELGRHGWDVTLVSGSREDLGEEGRAPIFYAGLGVHPVDFTLALRSEQPMLYPGGEGTAPMHPSYEDRPGADDRVFLSLSDEEQELQVEAWGRELERAGGEGVDMIYLHHLTPLNEAASRRFPAVPLVGHVHGSELLMLERIARGKTGDWPQPERWTARLRRWAAGCERIVVNSPQGLERAAELLELPRERFALVPNGFDAAEFAPLSIDRAAHWRRHLITEPRGWSPGEGPGSVRYSEDDLAAFDGPVLLYVGRFTEVKRLPLLIESFAAARERFEPRAPLVLLGGYPGEWELEHPLEAVQRLGVPDVFLAGWHGHDELPRFLNASDVLVLPSVREQFGQVIVEAMACAVPPIAVDRAGPATIVDSGETGWLVPPDDAAALADAMVEAVNDREERERRGRLAREVAVKVFSWEHIGEELASVLDEVARR